MGAEAARQRVMQVAANLMSIQRLDGNFHGVIAQTDRVAADGVLVKAVESSSPAATGGLQAGDLITRVNDRDIARPLDLERAFLGHKPGDDMAVVVQRDNKSVTLDLDVASRQWCCNRCEYPAESCSSSSQTAFQLPMSDQLMSAGTTAADFVRSISA